MRLRNGAETKKRKIYLVHVNSGGVYKYICEAERVSCSGANGYIRGGRNIVNRNEKKRGVEGESLNAFTIL